MTFDRARHHSELIQAYADEQYGGDWERVTVAEARAILFAVIYRENARVWRA